MEDTKLIAKKRDLQGSSNARRMRKAGALPGVLYADGAEALAVELDLHAVEVMLHHHMSETMLVDLEIDGEGAVSALVKEVQHHPVTGGLLHIDLQKMDAKRAIRVGIQVEITGEAAGVKAGGSLEVVLHEIAVECLPGDLMETLELDVSDLEIGDVLHISDLDLGGSYKVLDAADSVIVAVTGPTAEESDEDEEGAAVAE